MEIKVGHLYKGSDGRRYRAYYSNKFSSFYVTAVDDGDISIYIDKTGKVSMENDYFLVKHQLLGYAGRGRTASKIRKGIRLTQEYPTGLSVYRLSRTLDGDRVFQPAEVLAAGDKVVDLIELVSGERYPIEASKIYLFSGLAKPAIGKKELELRVALAGGKSKIVSIPEGIDLKDYEFRRALLDMLASCNKTSDVDTFKTIEEGEAHIDRLSKALGKLEFTPGVKATSGILALADKKLKGPKVVKAASKDSGDNFASFEIKRIPQAGVLHG
jgi:hypothetical protein